MRSEVWTRQHTRSDPDLDLVEGMARGEADSLRCLYERYGPALLAFLCQLLADRQLAEDVLHDSMLASWESAGQAKGQGVLVATVCLGPDCEEQCMRSAATSFRYYYKTQRAALLDEVFERIRRDLPTPEVAALEIVDTLPDNMSYVVDGAVPESEPLDPADNELVWTSDGVPTGGVTITSRVRPLEPGYGRTTRRPTEAMRILSGAAGPSDGRCVGASPQAPIETDAH